VVAHIELVAEAGLQLHPVGARHQGKQGIAHVEVEQVAAAGIGHHQQAALIEVPEVLHRQAGRALVLGEHAQLPAGVGLHLAELLLQVGALHVTEGAGQVDHRGGVIGQQLRVVGGAGRGHAQQHAHQGQQPAHQPALQAGERADPIRTHPASPGRMHSP
jgi:hypothetical protein